MINYINIHTEVKKIFEIQFGSNWLFCFSARTRCGRVYMRCARPKRAPHYIFARGPKCWWWALIKHEATGQSWLSFPLAQTALLLQSHLPANQISPPTLKKTTGHFLLSSSFSLIGLTHFIFIGCQQVLVLVWSTCRLWSLWAFILRDGERWRQESQFAALESAHS